ncbi:MAG: hypothetical protein AAF608_11745 [Pseudomonadota bacterium]
MTKFINRPAIRNAFSRYATKERTPRALKGSRLLIEDAHGPQGLAGTAFDYLARAKTAAHFRGKTNRVIANKMIAEECLERHGVFQESRLEESLLYIFQREFWEPLILSGIKNMNSFARTGRAKRELFFEAQYLAQVDLVTRSFDGPDPNFDASHRVSMELEAMLDLFDPGIFECFGDRIELNPRFAWGDVVGGADGDILVGDCLIELKATKKLSVTGDYLRQLAGYAALDHLGRKRGKQCTDRPRINRVAIYFARHNQLVQLTLDELFPNDGFAKFCAEFEAEQKEPFSKRTKRK